MGAMSGSITADETRLDIAAKGFWQLFGWMTYIDKHQKDQIDPIILDMQ